MPDIPENVKRGLKIMPVSLVDQVLELALIAPLTPIEWSEESELDITTSPNDGDDVEGLVKH